MHVCRECGQTSPGGGTCTADGTPLAAVEDDPLVGTTVGPYRVAQVIGVGGMGRVYKGVQPQIGSRVAIKVLAAELAHRGDVVERFFAEARSVNLIRHESLVNILDLATLPDGRPYIVMEFLDGAPLAQVMASAGPLPLGELARLMVEVLEGVALAHDRGIVHRDLKPDNLWVTPAGRAKVLDFGIAKLAPDQGGSVTHTGSLLGTPSYMSPEQALARPVDARADLYAMGIILYEAATGHRPFVADSVYELLRAHVEFAARPARELRPDMPEGYAQVIEVAMAKDPSHRFQNARAMAAALHGAAQGLPPAQWVSVAPNRTGTGASMPARGGMPSPSPRPLVPPATVPDPTPATALPTSRPRRGAGPWIAGGLVVAGGAVAAAVVLTRGGDRRPPLPPSIRVGPGVTAEGQPVPPTPPPASDQPAAAGLDDLNLAALSAALSELGSGAGSGSAADPLAGLGDLAGSLAAMGSAFGGMEALSSSWVDMHSLPTPRDLRHVDLAHELQLALDDLRRGAPDAGLTQLSVMGLGSDGRLDLSAGGIGAQMVMISAQFASPKKGGCAAVTINRFSSMVTPYPTGCGDVVPVPRCTPAQIVARAAAAGAPKNTPGMLTYSRHDEGPRWQVIAGTFMRKFDDACTAEAP